MTAAPGPGGLTLAVAGPLGEQAPPGEENLVMVAARALADAAGLASPSARLTIDKRVPVAAGMGGGSADAAATLRALDRLWGTALEPDALREVAARVGSDVPALLAGGAVFAAGRGERVHPVHVQATSWVVKPLGFAVRTPDAFAWWDAEGATGPDAGALIAAAETGNDELARARPLQRPPGSGRRAASGDRRDDRDVHRRRRARRGDDGERSDRGRARHAPRARGPARRGRARFVRGERPAGRHATAEGRRGIIAPQSGVV